jgi:pimeloyl-ACP methyl ester carboxylesterase
MPRIQVKQLNIHYQQAGQGQDVLCLLGWAQSTIMFEPTLNYLSKRFRVTVFDFPGFGQSEVMKEAWSMQDYVDFVLELCQVLQIKNPILIAHSFGARVAAIFATQQDTKKLILTGAAGLKDQSAKKSSFKTKLYRTLRDLLRSLKLKQLEELLKRHMGSADYRALSGVLRDSFVKIVNQDLQAYYAAIQQPTLLIWGELDEATPLWMGQALEQLMVDAGLVVFEKDDHYAYYHQIDRFHRIVDAFIKDDVHA